MPIPSYAPAYTPPAYEVSFPVMWLSRGSVEQYLTFPNGWVLLPGMTGLDTPTPALVEVEPATWDGSLVLDARYAAREVFLPLHYMADTTADVRDAVKAIAVLTDPKRGDVRLHLQHTDGTQRHIDGRLSAQFGSPLEQLEAGRWRKIGLTLRCPDPFWSSNEQTLVFQLGDDEQTQFLSDEFLPVQLDESQVVGDMAILNDGDADSYPVLTLTGPCADVTVEVGQSLFTVPDGLDEGQTLQINTGRGVQSVLLDDDPAWGALGPGAVLGPLEPGNNTVEVTLTGASSATTMTVTWTTRWLTAW